MVETTPQDHATADELARRRPLEDRLGTRLTEHKSVSILIPIFVVSLALPIYIYAGPLRLSPYRVILTLLFLPLLISWISGAAGRVRLPDILILLFAIWAVLALFLAHGAAFALEPAGIFLIETFGAYLLARRYVRNLAGFQVFVRSLVAVVVVILPFAIFENFTARPIILEIFGTVFKTHGNTVMEPRLGLDRAQGPFGHPILFGVICSSAFSLALYTLVRKRSLFVYLLRPACVGAAVASSLSVGALASLVTQVLLIAWDRITARVPHRWGILAFMSALFYVVIDVLSNRTPIEVLISKFTFNLGNSYNRIHIWHYGKQEVLNNPIFGIGLNDWNRAWWMSASMDNFWLLTAMQYGLPAFALFTLAVVLIVSKLGKLNGVSETVLRCRTGLLITIAGIAMSACTVHLWNASYVLFMFLLGSGAWMLEAEAKTEKAAPTGKRQGSVQPRSFPVNSSGI